MNPHPIDRRTALRYGAAALAGVALPGCTPRRTVPMPADAVGLAPVEVSEHRLIRTVAGLRPYRPSGFRLVAERLGEKVLIHNYGHGGAGVTLSWGSGRMALDLALEQPERRVAVLGCGAVGLATARLLQDAGFHVAIYARDLPPNTTSNTSGALWAPFGVAAGEERHGPFAPVLARAARFSHRYFQTLVGERYAVRWLPLHLLGENPGAGLPWMFHLTPELYNAARLSSSEHPFPHASAWRVHTMLIEPDAYLRALMEDVRGAGGAIHVRSFAHVRSVLALEEPVVVNCTGLGALDLFGDEELTPVRGQLAFLVPQPEVEYMYIAGGYYMFPRRDGILLGGTQEPGEWSTVPEPETIARLIEGNRRIAGAMRPPSR